MKILLSSRRFFLIGFILLAAANILVLSLVIHNRSGKPESLTTLTERELQLPYRINEDNSGLSLVLTWRALDKEDEHNVYSAWRSPAWFTAEKLEELGFDPKEYLNSTGHTTSYKLPVPKEVLIVLENDGEHYRKAVKRATAALEKEKEAFKIKPADKKDRNNLKRAEDRLKNERIKKTRLFAVDAGLELEKLRDKYPDQSRFIIAKGLVEPGFNYDRNKKKVSGVISRLSITSIHVPLKHRRVFDSILSQRKSTGGDIATPRFEADLAYGRRLEPWIVSVKETR